jgi:hypothetical protein
MQQIPSWESNNHSANQEIHRSLRNSLPCLKQPATNPYTEQDASSLHTHILFP